MDADNRKDAEKIERILKAANIYGNLEANKGAMDASIPQGMVAVVQGLRNAGLAVTIMEAGKQYTLLPTDVAETIKTSKQQNQRTETTQPTTPCHQCNRNYCAKPNTRDQGTKAAGDLNMRSSAQQATDGRYTTTYKKAHCNVQPTSPPVQLTEFPPQRPVTKHGDSNFVVGGTGSGETYVAVKSSSFRGGMSWPDRGSVCSPRPSREHDSFLSTLRRYPNLSRHQSPDQSRNLSPDRSAEIVQRLISYTQAKHCYEYKIKKKPIPSSGSMWAEMMTMENEKGLCSRKCVPDGLNNSQCDENRSNDILRWLDSECSGVSGCSRSQELRSHDNRNKSASNRRHTISSNIQAFPLLISKEVSTEPRPVPTRRTIAIPISPIAKRSKASLVLKEMIKLNTHLESPTNIFKTISSTDMTNDQIFQQKGKRTIYLRGRKSEDIMAVNNMEEMNEQIIKLVKKIPLNLDVDPNEKKIRKRVLKKLYSKLSFIYNNYETNEIDSKLLKCVRKSLNNVLHSEIYRRVLHTKNPFQVQNVKCEMNRNKFKEPLALPPINKVKHGFGDQILIWFGKVARIFLYRSKIDYGIVIKFVGKLKSIAAARPVNDVDYKSELIAETVAFLCRMLLPPGKSHQTNILFNKLAQKLVAKLLRFPMSETDKNHNMITVNTATVTSFHSALDKNPIQKCLIFSDHQIKIKQNLKENISNYLKYFLAKENISLPDDILCNVEQDLINIYLDSVELSWTRDELKNEMQEFLDETNVFKNKQKDDLIASILDIFKNYPQTSMSQYEVELIEDCPSDATFVVSQNKPKSLYFYKKRDESPHTTDMSIGAVSDHEMHANMVQYTKLLCQEIDDWLSNIHMLIPHERGFRQLAVNDLAGDIVDRHKYLEIDKTHQISEDEELENLKYLIFKWINKIVGKDNKETIEHAPDLLRRIRSIPVPVLTKPLANNSFRSYISLIDQFTQTYERIVNNAATQLVTDIPNESKVGNVNKKVNEYTVNVDKHDKEKLKVANTIIDKMLDDPARARIMGENEANIKKLKRQIKAVQKLNRNKSLKRKEQIVIANLKCLIDEWAETFPLEATTESPFMKSRSRLVNELANNIFETRKKIADSPLKVKEKILQEETSKWLRTVLVNPKQKFLERYPEKLVKNVLEAIFFVHDRNTFSNYWHMKDKSQRSMTAVSSNENHLQSPKISSINIMPINQVYTQTSSSTPDCCKMKAVVRSTGTGDLCGVTCPHKPGTCSKDKADCCKSSPGSTTGKSPLAGPSRSRSKSMDSPIRASSGPASLGSSLDLINTTTGEKTVQQLNEELYDNLVEWCEKIPIAAGTPEEQELAVQARIGMKIGIAEEIVKLRCDVRAVNDNVLFEDMLEEHIDSLLDCLPQTQALLAQKSPLKANLLTLVGENNQQLVALLRAKYYKEQLKTSVTNTVPVLQAQPAGEVNINNIVTDFIIANYKGNDPHIRNMYTLKIGQEIAAAVKNLRETAGENPVEAEKVQHAVFNAMHNVPVPTERDYREYVKEAFLHCEIDEWFKDLPMIPNPTPEEKVQAKNDQQQLAQKMMIIENEEGDKDTKMRFEVEKFLQNQRLRPGELKDAGYMVDELIHRIMNNENLRRLNFTVQEPCCAPGDLSLSGYNSIGTNPSLSSTLTGVPVPGSRRMAMSQMSQRPVDPGANYSIPEYQSFGQNLPLSSTFTGAPMAGSRRVSMSASQGVPMAEPRRISMPPSPERALVEGGNISLSPTLIGVPMAGSRRVSISASQGVPVAVSRRLSMLPSSQRAMAPGANNYQSLGENVPLSSTLTGVPMAGSRRASLPDQTIFSDMSQADSQYMSRSIHMIDGVPQKRPEPVWETLEDSRFPKPKRLSPASPQQFIQPPIIAQPNPPLPMQPQDPWINLSQPGDESSSQQSMPQGSPNSWISMSPRMPSPAAERSRRSSVQFANPCCQGSAQMQAATSPQKPTLKPLAQRIITMQQGARVFGGSQSGGPSNPCCKPAALPVDSGYKKAAAVIREAVVEWCQQLPIAGEPQRAAYLRSAVTATLISKAAEFNQDPEMLNDVFVYQKAVESEIDKIFEKVPYSEELDEAGEVLKNVLVERLKHARELAISEQEVHNYRSQIIETIGKVVTPKDASARQAINAQATSAATKEDIADSLLELNAAANTDTEKRDQCNCKLVKTIDKCVDDMKSHGVPMKSESDIKDKLYDELLKIPAPNKEALADEVHGIAVKQEIAQWFKELPIQTSSPNDEQRNNKLKTLLAKQIHDIERELPATSNNYEPRVKASISRWMKSLILKPGEESKARQLADQLTTKLKLTEPTRRIATPSQYSQFSDFSAPPIPDRQYNLSGVRRRLEEEGEDDDDKADEDRERRMYCECGRGQHIRRLSCMPRFCYPPPCGGPYYYC